MKQLSVRQCAALIALGLAALVLAGRLADMTLIRPAQYRERIRDALQEAQS